MAGIEGIDGTGVKVDLPFNAARTSDYPSPSLGWNSISAQSGAMTGIAAGGTIFSLRNLSAKLILVRRIGIGLIVSTGFTTAQKLDVALLAARGFTVSDSSGTAIALTGSNGKHRTSLATPTSLDCRISGAAALTAGTRTLDTLPLAQQAGWALAATAGVVIAPAPANLFSHDTGDHPLVLNQNEGFVLTLPTALGAAGAVWALVNMEFAEADAF
jgi:hypothetical protein